ncbi:MAG: DNA polymerase III subunit delta' [Candidatus Subteraquimicrobiales bacterium]|nr:DNA polymerase III subunit delta' [Candidatus Subteraquimicrobiales bacterium]
MTKVWGKIVGQEEAAKKLKTVLENASFSHAYLFFGPEGVGKRMVAEAFAMALNCPQRGCGSCSSCEKIEVGSHPDVYFVEPEGNFITVEQIRKVRQQATLKPLEGDVRVYVIDEADKMTSEAANALLKVLEEPPPDLVFVLITANLQSMLTTIVSRCQMIPFSVISITDIVRWLTEKFGISQERAELATRLSGGVLGKAIAHATEEWRFKRRAFVLKVAQNILELDASELFQTAEQLINEVKSPLEKLKNIHDEKLKEMEEHVLTKQHAAYVEKVFALRKKRELSRKEREGFNEVFDILTSWYRDVIVLNETKGNDLIINQDKKEELKSFAAKISSEKAKSALEIIFKTRELLRFNVNMLLVFEVMLFNLQGVC